MPRPSQPVPDDFALYASIEGNLKLRKRFNVGGATIERWRALIGKRYNRPAMPKPIKIAAKKRIRARWSAQERIEDLDDGFDLAVCVRSGGAGGW
jgi:hypothetical protein